MRRSPRPSYSIGILLPLLLGACRAAGPARDPSYSYAGPVSLSALVSRPLSWDKLDDLETWLDRYGSSANPVHRNDARLALADGREAFVRQDQGSVSNAVLGMRRARAKNDFQAVINDTGASSAQRARAQHGLARIGGLYTGSPKAASAASNRGTSLSVVRRSSWNAAPEVPRHMARHKAPWSRITVHHTAMPIGASSTPSSRSAEMRMVQKSHLNKPEGWGDIGYHFVIDPEGRIFEGRRLAWRGAHVAGMNDHNLGICLLGNFNEIRPTAASIASLERLLDDLRAQNGIARSAVTWHRNWPSANTACPGDNLEPFVRRYRDGLTLAQAQKKPLKLPRQASLWTRSRGGSVH